MVITMRDFPSCFGENAVQVADSSSSSSSSVAAKAAQNLVSCVYQCKLLGNSCLLTVTWTKNLMGQGLNVAIDDSDSTNQCSSCKVDIKPWLFSRKKGSKILDVNSGKINIFWDLSNARFGPGPEPIEGFYLAVTFDQQMVLLLGDLKKEAYNKIDINSHPLDCNSDSTIFVAKREHIFGKRFYIAKAQFSDKGLVHDITIECDMTMDFDVKDPCLVIRIDSKMVMQIKRLRWKFRGNHTILVDGFPVEVFWDVHNWLFGNATGNAVFMFQTHSVFDPSLVKSQKFKEDQLIKGLGFSLILYAWKHE